MHKLDLSNSAYEFWHSLDAKQYKQVGRKMMSLLMDASPPDSSELKGYEFRRADIGEYRIIYHLENDVLYVELIGKRNDDEVYKQLKRR